MGCVVEECNNKHYGKGYCQKHHARVRRNGTVDKKTLKTPCLIEDCIRYAKSKGYCGKHYMQLDSIKKVSRERALIRRYNITLDEYNERLIAQHGVCAICFSDNDGDTLVVDHNHITGKVRGLLCQPCNKGIGMLKTDEGTALLFSAIRYIIERV